MKKLSLLLLAGFILTPAIAEDYGTYDDDFDTYDEETYSAPVQTTSVKSGRDTYIGLRLHRNEHIAYHYSLDNGHSTTVRDNNFGIGVNIGNRLTDNVKIEFETMYTGDHTRRRATNFDYDVWSNMLNISFYKTYGGAVEPYIGVGVGLSGIWSDIDGAMGKSNDCDFDLSFAIMAGANFALNDYIDLNLGVRYIDYGDMEHHGATSDVQATEIYIGGAYKFSVFQK